MFDLHILNHFTRVWCLTTNSTCQNIFRPKYSYPIVFRRGLNIFTSIYKIKLKLTRTSRTGAAPHVDLSEFVSRSWDPLKSKAMQPCWRPKPWNEQNPAAPWGLDFKIEIRKAHSAEQKEQQKQERTLSGDQNSKTNTQRWMKVILGVCSLFIGEGNFLKIASRPTLAAVNCSKSQHAQIHARNCRLQ